MQSLLRKEDKQVKSPALIIQAEKALEVPEEVERNNEGVQWQ